MDNKRRWSNLEHWQFDDESLTDSVVLAQTHVDLAFGDDSDGSRETNRSSKRVLDSLILSPREDLLFWILMLIVLAFLAF